MSKLSLDNVTMQVVENSPSSVINSETVFHFRQDGDIVEASYAGGLIVAGRLVGRLRDSGLKFCFCQLECGSSYQTGISECELVLHDGKLQLTEMFDWTDEDRPPGKNVMREI